MFSLLFQGEGSFYATRRDLSQGGVLFWCDINSVIKIKLTSDGAERGPSPVGLGRSVADQ